MTEYIEDSDGVSFEDDISLLVSSKVDGLGFCGCGSPERVADMICRYLEAVDWAWECGPNMEFAHYWAERCQNMIERAKLEEDAFMLCAYIADSRRFTEHGGSVGGAWLSDKGRSFVGALRKALAAYENNRKS